MNPAERFTALKARREEMLREKQRAEGALAETLKRLQEKFKVKDVAEAKRKLAGMKVKLSESEAEVERLLDELEDKL